MSSKNTCKSDTSSSDEETFADALREATDHEFLKESLFNAISSDSVKNDTVQITSKSDKKSLRENIEQEDRFHNFGVSKTYKNFVAKKLDEILERSMELKTKEEIHHRKRKKDVNGIGIKLFNSSEDFLTAEETEKTIFKRKKQSKNLKEDNIDNFSKCQEAAVDPEWVLSKVDTKGWTNRRTDCEFKYKKMKDGSLIEQT